MNMQLVTKPTEQLTPAGTNIEVSATNPDEMAESQSALIAWARAKIEEMKSEVAEATDAFNNAVEHKWKSDPLKRIADRAKKRLTFYEKILSALEHGYTIIPNFQVTAFAIRTDRQRPLKLLSTSQWDTHEQPPAMLPESEGEYKNPFPEAWERTISDEVKATGTTPYKAELKQYWAKTWKDLEFPITMAKVKIMEAVNRAMALKLFDDLGIIPAVNKGDPIIVGRIHDWRVFNSPHRTVTFIIGWHLNTRDL